MVLTAACAGTRKGGDHLGSKSAYDPDHVLENFLSTPFVQSFFHVKGVPKIVGAGEKLEGCIISMHGHQFFGPKNTQCFKQFRTNFILTPTASGEGKQTGAEAATSAEHDKQRIVFIIGMGGDLEKTSRGGQLSQCECQSQSPLIVGKGGQLCGEWRHPQGRMD